MSRGPILLVAAGEQGRGGGHLIRCMNLTRELRALDREAWLFTSTRPDLDTLCAAAHFDCGLLINETSLSKKNWDCIVLDRFQTPPEEYARWEQLAPVIGIDEGGPARNYFNFLIDIIPDPGRTGANISGPSLLPLPEKPPPPLPRRTTGPLKVLISFGMEDTAELGQAAAKALAEKNTDNTVNITLLGGTAENNTTPNAHAPIANLNEHLREYDIVITHYGLTAFEALYAGVPVLLISPGAYHEKLAKAAGFYSLGIGKHAANKLPRLLLNTNTINETFIHHIQKHCAALAVRHTLAGAPRHTLAEFINNVEPDVSRTCPVCNTLQREAPQRAVVVIRFPERTYLRCKQCGVIAMNRLNPPPIEYEKEYFFELYQKQYGKTYLEDFPHLMAMAKLRLKVIESLLPSKINGDPPPSPILLDIGCAYGPFLAAAREAGFTPRGIDPAEDAVRYVTQILGISAKRGFFPGNAFNGAASCDVVTLWYVIEHFRDCVPALAEIRKTLKPGGVLAFATPSFSGISGRVSIRRFLEHSPADHWTIWSPAMCKKTLAAAGFKVKKIIVSGHHPERFPLIGKFSGGAKSPLYILLMIVSKLFLLGDTFEVYAVKMEVQKNEV